jgi:hypothetical protein
MKSIAFIFSFCLVGCVGNDPETTQPTPKTLSCLGILSCVSTNCTTADSCVDTCMQQGSTESQTEVTNLATCYQNAGCQDSTCLQKNCMTELQACVSASAPPQTGTPSDGQNLPPGNVPADFVGTWTAGDAFDPSFTTTMEFAADGSGRYAQGNVGSLGDCTSTTIMNYNGTAVIDATTITFYSEQASTTQSLCGQQGTVPAQLITTVFTYSWNADGSLDAIDQSCAKPYADSPSSVNLYCRYTYRKQ